MLSAIRSEMLAPKSDFLVWSQRNFNPSDFVGKNPNWILEAFQDEALVNAIAGPRFGGRRYVLLAFPLSFCRKR